MLIHFFTYQIIAGEVNVRSEGGTPTATMLTLSTCYFVQLDGPAVPVQSALHVLLSSYMQHHRRGDGHPQKAQVPTGGGVSRGAAGGRRHLEHGRAGHDGTARHDVVHQVAQFAGLQLRCEPSCSTTLIT